MKTACPGSGRKEVPGVVRGDGDPGAAAKDLGHGRESWVKYGLSVFGCATCHVSPSAYADKPMTKI